MEADAIHRKLQIIFREVFEDDSINISPEMVASDVERWDSLSHVDMMVMVEEGFGIRFSTREVTGMANVGQLLQTIASKLIQ